MILRVMRGVKRNMRVGDNYDFAAMNKGTQMVESGGGSGN
jgi:hypothetical protein